MFIWDLYNSLRSYGEFTSDNNNQSGQNYSTQGGQWFLGEISSYPESGEFVDLPRSFEGSWAETASLQTSGWVQKSTRFVSFEFSLFSPNSGVFSSYRWARGEYHWHVTISEYFQSLLRTTSIRRRHPAIHRPIPNPPTRPRIPKPRPFPRPNHHLRLHRLLPSRRAR